LLRAIQPEGRLVLNGQSYNIGGLIGQPNHAFLTVPWLADLKNDPSSLQFEGYSIGEPQERLAWKRVRYSSSSPWPPKGVQLEFKFKFPTTQPSAQIPSSAGRDLLWSDSFENLKEQWTVSKSNRDERIRFALLYGTHRQSDRYRL